ncbi:30S ribosomal protein S6 [Sneathiella litorea]|uniref:Small ribosomal subunit protein bS6 n=1 Tax=Sneathiella litorea TaxID=2606216 RepID=A0A6L8W780_9PROT|nr:30S ribosomal protein S6 [Sneathiella litorea]MZR30965.1 30S ribosomal protein S6 [Sneathiella litorea]
MPLYETVIIARQDISTQQVETLTENMSSFITDGGGTVAKVENWGLRNLAYKIKKNRKGHYVLLNLDTPVDAMKEMERNLLLNEDVLRHMTIRVEELEEGDSVMLQSRSARPERRRDSDDDDDTAKSAKSSDEDKSDEKTDEGEE